MVSDQSVYAINSGPASAPQAALWLGEPWGMKDIITVDMGGTSFDITLTRDGRANVSKNIDFLRYRIGIPMIQVETLGAGGGSIARSVRSSCAVRQSPMERWISCHGVWWSG